MIIDADVTLYPGSYDADDIIKDMCFSGIDQALISMKPPLHLSTIDDCAKELSGIISKNPDKFKGIAYVDPRLPECADTIKRCADLEGIEGIKIDSKLCGVRLDDRKAMAPVAEAAIKHGFPLFARVSASAFDLTHPMRLSRLLEEWPELQVAAINMGGASRPDFCADVFETAKEHRNLWLIGSANYWQRVPQAIEKLGADRLIFGSAAPDHCFMPSAKAAYEALLDIAGVSPQEKSAIYSDNILQLLHSGN